MTPTTVATVANDLDLSARAPGRPLRIVLMGFYNYESHALRIFHPLLKQRGHEVHSIFLKNYFTYGVPTQTEEDMVVDLVEKIQPDLVAMSVWSTYFKLAARLTDRIKARVKPVIIWGGIHPQTCPEESLQHADIVCRSEGEYVLAELTDRMSLGKDFTELGGAWVKSGSEVVRNPPHPLIPDLDVLPAADLSAENKHYLGFNAWRDVARWNALAVSYDVMAVRGCPYECTFCIHNFTRKASEGLGTYLRRRSVDHVMQELKAAVRERPKLRSIALSDDIFAPPRPWLEEFCARYKEEIHLPFVMYSFARMVDESKVRLMRDAGLLATTMGIQSGSERIRRDCYDRETSNEEIIRACEIFERHGVVRNLDFIGDNPYENDQDRIETVELLGRLPKPFYFNYFSLSYFPGVDLTTRALADGHIGPDEVEQISEKGYHLWGGTLVSTRSREDLGWDVAYCMAVFGVPVPVIKRLLRSPAYYRRIKDIAWFLRQVRTVRASKLRVQDALHRRPNLLQEMWANTNRDQASRTDLTIMQPNFDNSPFSQPIRSMS